MCCFIDTFERVYLLNFPKVCRFGCFGTGKINTEQNTAGNGVNHSSKRRPSEPNGSVVANTAGIVAARNINDCNIPTKDSRASTKSQPLQP